ncbi:glyoxylate reductase (NADP(+)) [Jiella sp. MQZ13P-4]|uniref:Glyoxylate reductase (NADP(+)) n=2 Tax=Jiella sonneratiae TaxID=2816856 RepID=A0ABS3J989_9HYPH|nr:glyoxylate reductase (NADP(+)) [Jiella sonneratiae]
MPDGPNRPGPVIVNQIDAAFSRVLAGHRSRPRVIEHFDAERPWTLPESAEILVTRAMGAWRSTPGDWTPPPRLAWVQTYSAGVDIYPPALMAGRLVTCGRGLTSPQIAEYVLAAILRFEKRLDEVRARSPADWIDREIGAIEGKCLGLLGYGSIGREVARRAAAFGMEIRVCRNGPWTSDDPIVRPCASPAELVALADHLVLAVPSTPATRGMVDAGLLGQARPGLHLVNVSRGAVLDHDALLAAIDAGRIAGATLDVTAPEPLPAGHPLWTRPGVLLTPHLSFKGGREAERFAARVTANIDAYLASAPMQDLVDQRRGY